MIEESSAVPYLPLEFLSSSLKKQKNKALARVPGESSESRLYVPALLGSRSCSYV
jgi:hypothetical protein